MSLPIGVQLYSVRDSMEEDFVGTLKKIKEMGYDGVEFAGLFGNSPEYVRGVLDALELVPVSAHVPLDEMIAEGEKYFADYQTIGCKFVAVPYVTPERRPGSEDFEKTIGEITRLGEIAKKYGITLLYHNHDFEFVRIDGEYGLDVLYSRIPADCLQTEIDTCWVNVAGVDPTEYVLKYTGRAPVVHLKDFNITGKLPEKLYALIGLDEEEDNNKEEKGSFEFRPAGHGMQNVPSILDASVRAGAGWIVVEQDEPSMGLSRMDSVRASREYLKSIGW